MPCSPASCIQYPASCIQYPAACSKLATGIGPQNEEEYHHRGVLSGFWGPCGQPASQLHAACTPIWCILLCSHMQPVCNQMQAIWSQMSFLRVQRGRRQGRSLRINHRMDLLVLDDCPPTVWTYLFWMIIHPPYGQVVSRKCEHNVKIW